MLLPSAPEFRPVAPQHGRSRSQVWVTPIIAIVTVVWLLFLAVALIVSYLYQLVGGGANDTIASDQWLLAASVALIAVPAGLAILAAVARRATTVQVFAVIALILLVPAAGGIVLSLHRLLPRRVGGDVDAGANRVVDG
jgi:hypothetical protein